MQHVAWARMRVVCERNTRLVAREEEVYMASTKLRVCIISHIMGSKGGRWPDESFINEDK